MHINPYFKNLQESYLFVDIANRLSAYKEKNPDADIIRMGIGDVTRPLAKPVVDAMAKAVAEQGQAETFHGYAPEQGYTFLRESIAAYYAKRGVTLDLAEIFVSDGAKSDIGNILELFERENKVLVPDPVYPAYVDANIMAGRAISFISATRENDFLPLPDKSQDADIIYLCSPNNPTGAAYDRDGLKAWVDYANEKEAVILFDAAYEAFVSGENIPHSIFEVEGAENCAIEICSLSKTAGFTGTRCGYTIVPAALTRGGQKLNELWARRQAAKFNEVSYIVQRGAEAVFSKEGLDACFESITYYKNNAAVLGKALQEAGCWYCGGVNGPYIWLECPGGMGSWEFFDLMLNQAGVVGTPGAGFGRNGEGYFRLTGFGDAQRTEQAAQRIKKVISSL